MRHPIYTLWANMIQRCTNPSNNNYPYYGGRGIKICKAWRKYSVFNKWCLENGWAKGLTLDRTKNNGNYCPSNCRFITRAEQCRNQSSNKLISWNGETKCITDWANQLGIGRKTLDARVFKFKWPIDIAMTTKSTSANKIKNLKKIYYDTI